MLKQSPYLAAKPLVCGIVMISLVPVLFDGKTRRRIGQRLNIKRDRTGRGLRGSDGNYGDQVGPRQDFDQRHEMLDRELDLAIYSGRPQVPFNESLRSGA